jgi:phosphoglycerate dehydrogenase-like enzyme
LARATAISWSPVSLNRLIRGADFISLHLPLTARTRHIIDAQRLQQMKGTSYLINTARGELVDENALQTALIEGRIGGGELDVMEHEPPGSDHSLRSSERVDHAPLRLVHTTITKRTAPEGLRRSNSRAPRRFS